MPASITSLQNPRVKAAMRLRDGRHRQKQQQIVIDGLREVQFALNGDLTWNDVFVCPALLGEQLDVVVEAFNSTSATLWEVPDVVFAKLTYGHRTEGIVATAKLPSTDLAKLQLTGKSVVVVLEGVEKPGNVGAVFRTADAAGAEAVVLASPRTDLFNPNAIRASLGTLFTVPSAIGTSAEVFAWLQRENRPIFAAWVDDADDYSRVKLMPPAAIVLGSEADGLTDVWRQPGVTKIQLPMLGTADSLNVSNTAAILLYEALRQRQSIDDRQ